MVRDQLLDRVWGRDIYVDTRTVDVHVGRLRKALCQNGGDDPLRTCAVQDTPWLTRVGVFTLNLTCQPIPKLRTAV